jgi:hypothetical protein
MDICHPSSITVRQGPGCPGPNTTKISDVRMTAIGRPFPVILVAQDTGSGTCRGRKTSRGVDQGPKSKLPRIPDGNALDRCLSRTIEGQRLRFDPKPSTIAALGCDPNRASHGRLQVALRSLMGSSPTTWIIFRDGPCFRVQVSPSFSQGIPWNTKSIGRNLYIRLELPRAL